VTEGERTELVERSLVNCQPTFASHYMQMDSNQHQR
jgi:hypothetical protein